MTPRYIIYITLVLCACLYGIVHYRQFARPYKLLVMLLVSVFLCECLSRVLVYSPKHTSIPAYHILISIQMILYPAIYFKALHPKKNLRRLMIGLAIFSTAFSILNSIFIQTLYTFPSNSILLVSLLSVSFALLSFYFMLQNPTNLASVRDPFFWFNVGNLFFYCTTFFIFGLFTQLVKRGGLPEWTHHVIYFANILLYTSYFITLFLDKKQHASR